MCIIVLRSKEPFWSILPMQLESTHPISEEESTKNSASWWACQNSVLCWCFFKLREIVEVSVQKFLQLSTALIGKPLSTAISVRRCRKAWPEPWPFLPSHGDAKVTTGPRCGASSHLHEPISQTSESFGSWLEGSKFYIESYWNMFFLILPLYRKVLGLKNFWSTIILQTFHFTNAWQRKWWVKSRARFILFKTHTHKCPSPRRWQRPRFEWLHFLQAPSVPP